MHSYRPVYVLRGRIMAPVEPYVTAVAASVAYNGSQLIVTRGDRFTQLPVQGPAPPAQWAQTYVEIAPLLRNLGVRVTYDARERRLEIDTRSAMIAAPTPFNPAVPLVSPAAIFTPVPVPTARPAVTGKPAPRRTPSAMPCCKA
jgi:hypothetical protein